MATHTPGVVLADRQNFHQCATRTAVLINKLAMRASTDMCRLASDGATDESAELEFLRMYFENLRVQDNGRERGTLKEMFVAALTDERLEALDTVAEPDKVWSLPGFQELGQLRIARDPAAPSELRLRDVFPVLHGEGSNQRVFFEFPPPNPPPVSPFWVMHWGNSWWMWLLGSKHKAWTKTQFNGLPYASHHIMTDLSDGCGQTVFFRMRKIRYSTASVELSKTIWGAGASLGVGSKHKAYRTESYQSGVEAGCMVYAPSHNYEYV